MKKIIIFLISTFILITIPIKEVKAQTQGFYQAEYISGIFLHKLNSNGVSLYSQARYIRKTDTNEIAYCIEPQTYFKDGHLYEINETIPNYTKEQILDMTLLSHFGYGYKNHTEEKWYPITQALIWEIANPSMKYLITPNKSLNSPQLYSAEKEELKALVNNYKKETSLNNKTYTIVEGEDFSIIDENNILSNYNQQENIKIENNKITVTNLSLGTNKIYLTKESNLYNRHPLFYTNKDTQDVMDIGDPNKITESFTINVINTELNLIKIDFDTKKETPQGIAELINSTFNIYKRDNTLIKTIKINNTKESINNLPLGEYYIQEINPGFGYELNTEKYYFEITESTPQITITIPNKSIKVKTTIKKEFGIEDNFQPETNISFNIYQNNELIQTIITNEQGIAEIYLPYGTYTIKQLTTTEGYSKITPIEFTISSNEEIIFNLKDYKITVPDTNTESFISKIIKIIINIICGKK